MGVFFQNEKYFSHNRSEILDLFEIEPLRQEYLCSKYSELKRGVFVHYRRKDYLHSPQYCLTGDSYYKYCLKIMNEIFPDAHYYIFSDDIEHCEGLSYLKDLPQISFVKEDDVNCLYLMSMCFYGGIGTNSTFSWWGGWLNTNEEKKVMYPEKWFGNRTDLDIWWKGCYKMKDRPKRHFLTFGGGPMYYLDGVDRLTEQAQSLELFDHIYGFKEGHLKEEHPFWEQNYKFILQNPHGFGYWIWKPYLVYKVIQEAQYGDVIVYCDSGNELDIRKKDKIKELLDACSNEQIIGSIFQGHEDISCRSELYWTKHDVLLSLNANISDRILHSPQREVNSLIICKTKKTEKLMKEWCDTCVKNYQYINDFPSYVPNLPEFIVHKHVQSVFSILSKHHNIFSEKYTTRGVIDVLRNHRKESMLNEI